MPRGREALTTLESKAVCGMEGTEVFPGLSTKTAPPPALMVPAPRAPSQPIPDKITATQNSPNTFPALSNRASAEGRIKFNFGLWFKPSDTGGGLITIW